MPRKFHLRAGVSILALLMSFLFGAPAQKASAATGDLDSSLSLNGSTHYAEVADTTGSAFDITGTFTLEAWLYTTNDCASDRAAFSKYLSYMVYCGSNGFWKYALSSDGTTWTGTTTEIRVETNAWHHLAFTKTSANSNLLFYYDGQYVNTYTSVVPTTMTPNNQPFSIGRSTSGGNYWQGMIDEVRIYSAQRTASQILSDMNTWGPGDDSSLAAYYDFNDESGSTIANADSTPASNTTLTAYNTPTYSSIESSTVVNGDQVVTFPRSYLTSNGGWKIPSHVSTIKSLVVGGGGSGGSRAGGGGGAGGYVYDSALSVTANSYVAITVGAGGFGLVSRQGKNGLNSSLGNLRTALGGGGGGHAGGADNSQRVGLDGGSGGGASGSYTSANSSAAYGYSTQNSTYSYGAGFRGGSGYSGVNWPSGGGGGAGGAGAHSDGPNSLGGKGGAGVSDPIGGTGKCYATGGGGGINGGYPLNVGQGGDCGSSASPNNNAGTSGANFPGYALANTGSGGGGGGFAGASDAPSSFGAAGVVILRYPLLMSISISFSGGSSATYRTTGTLSATSTLSGRVTFYERGKPISGCKGKVMDSSFVATCSWKPSIHGIVTITATATPTNTYVPNGSNALNISVSKRTNQR